MKITAIAAVLLLTACETQPDFPVPEQRRNFELPNSPAGRLLNMNDPGVTYRFVRDISSDLTANWRWAFQKPAVKIRVRTDRPLKYTIDFAVPDFTMKETGPVTIAFTVNDRELDRVRYDTPGDHHFEKPIPPGWMRVDEEVILGAEIDKMWTSQSDGARFGFIITRIGLAK